MDKTHCLVASSTAENDYMNQTNTQPKLSSVSSDISSNGGTTVYMYATKQSKKIQVVKKN